MTDTHSGNESAAQRAYSASAERLCTAATQTADSARSYVHQQPLAALGIAVASGFLLGWILRKQ